MAEMKPGMPITDILDREGLRMKLIRGENILSPRERAEIRYQLEAEHPYPENAEMALYDEHFDRVTEWIPVSQRTWGSVDDSFKATSLWVRIGGEMLHSRPCYANVHCGGTLTAHFPPISWNEYVERNSLPNEWLND